MQHADLSQQPLRPNFVAGKRDGTSRGSPDGISRAVLPVIDAMLALARSPQALLCMSAAKDASDSFFVSIWFLSFERLHCSILYGVLEKRVVNVGGPTFHKSDDASRLRSAET